MRGVKKIRPVIQMYDITDVLFYRIADDVSNILSDQVSAGSEVNPDLSLLETLVAKLPSAVERARGSVINEIDVNVKSLTGSIRESDTVAVLRSESEARRGRLDRMEQESMAKLVNKMRSREEVSEMCNLLIESIRGLEGDSLRCSSDLEVRRAAVVRLRELIPLSVAALQRDIEECSTFS
jgi:hypothetical protein